MKPMFSMIAILPGTQCPDPGETCVWPPTGQMFRVIRTITEDEAMANQPEAVLKAHITLPAEKLANLKWIEIRILTPEMN